MKTILKLCVATAALILSSVSIAQERELVITVPEKELEVVSNQNDYFLKKHLYFSKRHRIVKIDTNILENAKSFTISLFDDVSLNVERTLLDANPDRSTIIWKGTIVDPPFSVSDIQNHGHSLKQAEIMHDTLFGVSIAAGKYKFDSESGETRPIESTVFNSSGQVVSRDREADSGAVYGISSSIGLANSGSEFKISALELDSRYHVITEIDPTKTFHRGPLDDPANPEQASKRQQYREFLNSIGGIWCRC